MGKFDDKVNKFLTQLIRGITSQRELNRLGIAARRIIRLRTFKGLDVDGKPFKPYSDAHAEKREDLGLPVHPVDLRIEDADGMLSDPVFHHVVNKNLSEVDLDFHDPEKRKIAFYHDQAGVGKAGENIRHFWGLSDNETSDIVDLIDDDVAKLINKITTKLSD